HRPDLTKVGQAADRPQAARLDSAPGSDRRIFGEELQNGQVDRFGGRAEDRIVALSLEAADKGADVGEIEIGVAPMEGIERPEPMILDRLDLFSAQAAAFLGQAERSERAV